MKSPTRGDHREMRLDELAGKWDASFPNVSQIWRRNWNRIVPFFNRLRGGPGQRNGDFNFPPVASIKSQASR